MKKLVLMAVLGFVAGSATGATYTVTKTSDDPVDGCDTDCSLREAVIAANATVEHDTIVVPPGTYVLGLVGPGEDAAATGDLDLLQDVSIVGHPTGGTVIDGNLSDRLVHLNGATVELSDLVLTRGSTAGDFYGAGGILVEAGSLTMTRCTVSACGTDHYGGAIFSLGVVTLDQSAIVGNTATGHGGAIEHAGAELTLINSTVSGNTTQADSSGAVDIDGLAGSTIISSCTFSDSGGAGADAMVVRSAVTITNTVFDGSCEVVVGMGTVQTEGGNLESPGDTCMLDHVTDIVGVTPGELNLGPLQDNGGLTPTHALQVGSVAIDSGNNILCPSTDQRDWLRQDGSCDIGAFEEGAVEPLVFADGFETGDASRWSVTVGYRSGAAGSSEGTGGFRLVAIVR